MRKHTWAFLALVAVGAALVAGQPASGQGEALLHAEIRRPCRADRRSRRRRAGLERGGAGSASTRSPRRWNGSTSPASRSSWPTRRTARAARSRASKAAQKLVNVDHVQVIIGDFYSLGDERRRAPPSTIPNNVLIFTGGTNPALTKLNDGLPVALVWEPVAADDIQGKVLAHLLAEKFGKTAKINVAARNDGYGAALSAIFKEAWEAGGGTVPQFVVYNHQQPTLDTEAQQVVEGEPGRLAVHRFLPHLREARPAPRPHRQMGRGQELRLRHAERLLRIAAPRTIPACARPRPTPLPARPSRPSRRSSRRRRRKASASSPFTAEAFDSAFIAFFAALEAKSSDPAEIAKHVVSVTNDPGTKYTFEQIDDAIKARPRRREDPFRRRHRRSQLLRRRAGELARLRHLGAPAGRLERSVVETIV